MTKLPWDRSRYQDMSRLMRYPASHRGSLSPPRYKKDNFKELIWLFFYGEAVYRLKNFKWYNSPFQAAVRGSSDVALSVEDENLYFPPISSGIASPEPHCPLSSHHKRLSLGKIDAPCHSALPFPTRHSQIRFVWRNFCMSQITACSWSSALSYHPRSKGLTREH